MSWTDKLCLLMMEPQATHIYCCRWLLADRRTLAEGAKGSASCVAPPGWAQAAAGANITACPLNTYKAGWSNDPCTSCGTNVFTNSTGSVSRDNCLVPPGYGLVQFSPTLLAKK